jgi:LTXXQ motif family protein
MKSRYSILFATLFMIGSAMQAAAQQPGQQPPTGDDIPPALTSRDYDALIREVFAPITEQLNLTREQEFQIVAIITGTEVQADPLEQRVDEIEQLLTQAELSEAPVEADINRLAAEEAQLLTRIIAMKARAKAGIYLSLSPAQRSLLVQKFRTSSGRTENLGGLSTYQ